MYIIVSPMGKILQRFLFSLAALCLAVSAAASGQSDNYDKALDKYAYICARCVELRGRVASGQNVDEESLKSLLKELSALRKTLSGASGRMSAAQVARFEEIKKQYRQGSVDYRYAVRRESIDMVGTLPQGALSAHPGSGIVPMRQRREQTSSKAIQTAFLADAGIFPTPSFGAMAVLTRNGVGAYAVFKSDFRKNEYSYVCDSDGATEYGRVWTTGKSRVSRLSAAAGLAMFTSRRFGFRAGAGWTSYTRCWEDVSGQWAKVGDKSFGRFAVDGGIFLVFKPLAFSVGVMSDFSGHADLNFGVGVRF